METTSSTIMQSNLEVDIFRYIDGSGGLIEFGGCKFGSSWFYLEDVDRKM